MGMEGMASVVAVGHCVSVVSVGVCCDAGCVVVHVGMALLRCASE